jgi:hypothetical protein
MRIKKRKKYNVTNNTLLGIERIPLVEYKPNKRRHNSGAKRLYNVNLDDKTLTFEEKYLAYLIQNLDWSYIAISNRMGCTRQTIHKQYIRIVEKTCFN